MFGPDAQNRLSSKPINIALHKPQNAIASNITRNIKSRAGLSKKARRGTVAIVELPSRSGICRGIVRVRSQYHRPLNNSVFEIVYCDSANDISAQIGGLEFLFQNSELATQMNGLRPPARISLSNCCRTPKSRRRRKAHFLDMPNIYRERYRIEPCPFRLFASRRLRIHPFNYQKNASP